MPVVDARGHGNIIRQFMVRRLEKRFKNILTMNIVFWRAVIAGDNATYGDKMRFSVTF
ncbi:hypothetical protein ACK6SV_25020 [Citrobacter freundii]|uniref:hypothetical protein n=1 Tax=Citrobacter freundii TaxID=546 RepID=UPI0039B3A002